MKRIRLTAEKLLRKENVDPADAANPAVASPLYKQAFVAGRLMTYTVSILDKLYFFLIQIGAYVLLLRLPDYSLRLQSEILTFDPLKYLSQEDPLPNNCHLYR